MDSGAVLARGVSKTTLRNAAEATRGARSTDGSISRGSALGCASELTAIFLRGANDARKRGETYRVDRRIGAVYDILDGIATE